MCRKAFCGKGIGVVRHKMRVYACMKTAGPRRDRLEYLIKGNASLRTLVLEREETSMRSKAGHLSIIERF